MVTTLNKSRAQNWTWSGARFVRQTPSEKQIDAPKPSLLYKRARYYDPNTGEFISRDPLEYVDGMSQYRAYFVPRGMDPLGLAMLSVNGNLPDPRRWYWNHPFVGRPDKFTVTRTVRDGVASWKSNIQLLWGYSMSLSFESVRSVNGRLRVVNPEYKAGEPYGVRNSDLIKNDLYQGYQRVWKTREESAKDALRGDGDPMDGKCVECVFANVSINLEAFSEELSDGVAKAIAELLKQGQDAAAEALAKRYGIPIDKVAELLLDFDGKGIDNTMAVSTRNVLVTCADGKEFVGAYNLPNTAGPSGPESHGRGVTETYYEGVTTLINSTPAGDHPGRPTLADHYEASSD